MATEGDFKINGETALTNERLYIEHDSILPYKGLRNQKVHYILPVLAEELLLILRH